MATDKFKRRTLTDEARLTSLAGQTGTLHSAVAKEKLAGMNDTPAAADTPAAPTAAATDTTPTPAPSTAPVTAAPNETPAASVATTTAAPTTPAAQPTDTSADLMELPAPARPRRGRGAAAPSPAASTPARVQGYTVALPSAYGPVLRTATIMVESKRASESGGPSQKVTVGELVQSAVDKLLAQLRKQGLAIPEVEK